MPRAAAASAAPARSHDLDVVFPRRAARRLAGRPRALCAHARGREIHVLPVERLTLAAEARPQVGTSRSELGVSGRRRTPASELIFWRARARRRQRCRLVLAAIALRLEGR